MKSANFLLHNSRFLDAMALRKLKRLIDLKFFLNINIKQGYTLKKWVEGLSDEAYYPCESPKKIRLKSANPTFASERKKV